jgi:hypothetical protein
MLSGVSPCEDPNEASYPHVRESVETVPSSLIDPIFSLVYVLLRELLLQTWQRISARPSSAFMRPGLKIFPLTRIISQLTCGM